ncbi:MAG: hypothetical protein ACYSTG_10565 [Planctomycetota bacterium]
MKTKIFNKWGFLTLLGILLLNLGGCCPPFCPPPPEPAPDCSKQGSNSLFVATFDSDSVGSPPAPSTPLHYGPPGASLNLQDGTNTIVVIDSASLGSHALKITRGQPNATIIDAVAGKISKVPHTAGTYYIDFKAHGEVIPQYLIAGMAISVRSAEDRSALNLKLFDGSYHLLEGGAYNKLAGSYNPGTAHSVHIELNMDERKYSVCIDDEVVAANKTFLQDDFTNLHLLRFFAPATITEAFSMTYVVDDIRITK